MKAQRFGWLLAGSLVLAACGQQELAPELGVLDTVNNDVVVDGNDTFEAGGSTTINYKISNTNSGSEKYPDPLNRCNPADGTTATVSVVTPTGVTATPSSLTFSGCDSNKSVVFSSNTVGTYEITVNVSDSGTGTYYTAPATFTLKVTSVAAPADTTKPIITDLGPTSQPNSIGWYASAVTNTFEAQDNVGFGAGIDNPYKFTKSSGANEGIAVKINSGTVLDAANNEAIAIDSAAFKIDLSDPTNVKFVGGVSSNGVYYYNDVASAPTCSADDAVSGLKSCVVTGYSTAVGPHTLTATATDNAGRTSTSQLSYEVKAWRLSGFYSPVDMGGVVNTVKAGATVPLKFEVFAASELTDTSAISSFKTAAVPCGELGASADEIEVTTTGGTSLRYDATAGQFIQNWQTPKTAGACYRATMTTLDGSAITAYFKAR